MTSIAVRRQQDISAEYISTKINNALYPRALIEVWKKYKNNFGLKNITNLLYRVSRFEIGKDIRRETRNIVNSIMLNGGRILRECDFQIAEDIVRVLEKQTIVNNHLLQALASRLLEQDAALLKNSSIKGICNIAKGFANLGIRREALFTGIGSILLDNEAALLRRGCLLSIGDIIGIASSFAKIGIEHEYLFQTITNELLFRDGLYLKTCSAHQLVTFLDSCATLNFECEELFEAIIDRFVDNRAWLLKQCRSTELTSLVRSCARLHFQEDRLRAAITEHLS